MISNLSLGNLEPGKLRIPLPAIDEQRRIAAILDKADAIRRKRQQALALADDFLKSVFLEMFGDPENDTRRPTTTSQELLQAIGTTVSIAVIAPNAESRASRRGVPNIRTGDFEEGAISLDGLHPLTSGPDIEGKERNLDSKDLGFVLAK